MLNFYNFQFFNNRYHKNYFKILKNMLSKKILQNKYLVINILWSMEVHVDKAYFLFDRYKCVFQATVLDVRYVISFELR